MTYLEAARSAYSLALLPPDRRPIAAWIEDNRILPRGSAEEGRKKVSRTPAIAPIYQWFRDPFVREIVVLKSAQIGYTDALVDLILWIAVNDPAPTALFLADQATAKKIMLTRIRPAMDALGLIRHKTGDKRQEATSYEIRTGNGFHLIVSWASSIAATASMAYKYVFADELDKPGYMSVGTEGDTIGRIRERTETYQDHKILWGSTPTLDTGLISKEFAATDARFDFCVPCCHCGTMQPLTWSADKHPTIDLTGSVEWEGGKEATRQQIAATVRYRCGSCGELWTSDQKNAALEHGAVMLRDGDDKRPRTVGYSINRLHSLFPGGRLDAMATNFVRSVGDPGKLQNFINSSLGQAWVQRMSATQDDAFLSVAACKADVPRGVVPDQALVVVAFVDVQNNGTWWRVRAFATDMTSWGIDEGFCPSWEELEDILFERTWAKQDGSELHLWRVMFDTGGGKADGSAISRTEETYFFIRRNQRRNGVALYGSKGTASSMPSKIKLGKPIERTPSGKPLAGGIQIVSVNSDLVKDALWWRIERTKDHGPGSWYLHKDTEATIIKQIIAEEKRANRQGIIEWHRIRPDNHILDCEVGCLVLVDPELYGGIKAYARALAAKSGKPQAEEEEKPRDVKPNPFTRRQSMRPAYNPYLRR